MRQLQSASERFRTAGRLLRGTVQRDNTFVAELAALQHFWHVRWSGTEGAPFTADLSFPLSHSQSHAQASAAGRAQPPRIPAERLTITQGFEGHVIVGAPPDERVPPTVQVKG